MKKKIIPYLILTFIITGCKKTVNSPISVASPVYLPKTFTNTRNNQTINYQFDTKNRLIDVTTNFPTPSEEKFIYDSNDNIIEADDYANGTQIETDYYTYSAGLIKVQIVSTVNSNFVMNLNNDNSVAKISYRSIYLTFGYDSSGNISTYTYFPMASATSPSYIYNYTFDGHKSRFLNIKGNSTIAFFGLNAEITNNLQSYTYTSPSNPSQNITVNYTYVYNTDGYPVSRTSLIGGVSGTETFTYTVK